jgi:hypothetical protein
MCSPSFDAHVLTPFPSSGVLLALASERSEGAFRYCKVFVNRTRYRPPVPDETSVRTARCRRARPVLPDEASVRTARCRRARLNRLRCQPRPWLAAQPRHPRAASTHDLAPLVERPRRSSALPAHLCGGEAPYAGAARDVQRGRGLAHGRPRGHQPQKATLVGLESKSHRLVLARPRLHGKPRERRRLQPRPSPSRSIAARTWVSTVAGLIASRAAIPFVVRPSPTS